jgi:ubiquinone biosynthesis protein
MVAESFPMTMLRIVQCVAIVALHLARWLLTALWLRLTGTPGTSQSDAGRRASALIESLGPSFTKAGQLLSTRADLLPLPILEHLRKLQDRIHPVSPASIRRQFQRGLRKDQLARFRHVDWTPLAVGSIAQVHLATLIDGTHAAVKIRRPGVDHKLRADIAIMRTVARLLSRLPAANDLPLTELVEEVILPLREQLQFRLEGANSDRFRAMFDKVERVRMPRVIHALSSESVLTLEYLDGLRRVRLNELAQEQRREAALAGLRTLYRMIFLEGFVHADMHESNVFLGPSGELVILDTGFVARLSHQTRQDFVAFFIGLATNRGNECARIVVRGASSFGRRYDPNRFESDIASLVRRYSTLKSSEFQLGAFVVELLEVQRRWQVRGSTAFIMTVVAMLVFEGICKQLYPDCDFQSEARPFLIVAHYGRRSR